jgi:LuxR family maltose regulon positive regulatory protein
MAVRSRRLRPWAWVSLDKSDDDPANLLSNIAGSLSLAGLLGEDEPTAIHSTSGSAISHGVPRLVRALKPDSDPGILVLDNFEALQRRDSIDVVGAVFHQLDGRLQVAVASRSDLKLPTAALRPRGAVFELNADDLALSEREAELVLQASGIHSGYDLGSVMARTEGWPVGVYLTALAMRVGSPSTEVLSVGGNDLYIAEYLRNEILDHIAESRVTFLTRTSVLDQLSGSLCDAVLEITGSGRVLEDLESSNLLIVRLDRTREWHRYHHMFQELLQAELRLREPEAVAGLHARAADWFEANEILEAAIHHAQAADDLGRVARLVVSVARSTYAAGRSDTLLQWLDWLDRSGQVGHDPAVSAIGALACSLAGDRMGVERWVISDDVSNPVARLACAFQARSGTGSIIEEMRMAREALAGGSGWLPAVAVAEALALLWEGEIERADAMFAEAISMAEIMATPTATLGLAERAIIAMESGDWSSAEDHSRRSLRLTLDGGLEGYVTSALGFVAAARLARRHNDIDKARELLAQAATLRPRLNTALPGISVQVLIEMAKGYLELSDTAGARLVLRDAQDIDNKYPDLGHLPQQLDQVRRELTTAPGTIGPSTLTTAELRVLPMLATHLTFPQIAERLFVSRHTIKTQAMSIYRKLGAASRGEAVELAREFGFLGV